MAKKAKTKPAADAAYKHFKLRYDPFTTLSLGPHNLDLFTGREGLLDRLSSAVLSLSNVGVAGEPGAGKSSVLQALKRRVPSSYHCVSIGVPLDDASYFLSELLREILVAIPSVPGVNLKLAGKRLEAGELSKNAVLSIVRAVVARLKKPLVVFVDDLEKIKGDRLKHLTRSERTLQLLEELRPLLELPNACFAVALQEEFHARVASVVREGGEPTVLGLFKHVVLVEDLSREGLVKVLAVRLARAGFQGSAEDFLEPEALVLALALSNGNCRRFLYLLSEAMYLGFKRGGPRVEFQDLFEAVNEHLKLDGVCRKLLYFLAKSGRAVASNPDLQAFMDMDMISIARRLEILSKNRLAEMVDVVDGVKVYALPGSRPAGAPRATEAQVRITTSAVGERIYTLLGGEGEGEG